MAVKRVSKSLIALSKSAALIPLYSSYTSADAPPAFTELGLRFTKYKEAKIDSEKVIYGSADRYDIDVTQANLITPIGRNWFPKLGLQNWFQNWRTCPGTLGLPGNLKSAKKLGTKLAPPSL